MLLFPNIPSNYDRYFPLGIADVVKELNITDVPTLRMLTRVFYSPSQWQIEEL